MKKRPGLASMFALYRREMLSYLTTPTAYVFVAVFLFAIGLFTFQVGGFFEQRRADLSAFFAFHPWIFMVFLPAVAMRLWSEESRSGAIESADERAQFFGGCDVSHEPTSATVYIAALNIAA